MEYGVTGVNTRSSTVLVNGGLETLNENNRQGLTSSFDKELIENVLECAGIRLITTVAKKLTT